MPDRPTPITAPAERPHRRVVPMPSRRDGMFELIRGLGADGTRTTWRDDLVAALLSCVLVAGLFIDGWAHIHFRDGALGPFFTPWHGILYAGFGLTEVWVLSRRQSLGAYSLRRVPAGYGLSYLGLALAPVAVGGDAVWHTVFGEERGLARLVAPFHLFLFASAALLVTGPYRATRHRMHEQGQTGVRAHLPATLSLTLFVAMISFFFQWTSPVVDFFKPLPVSVRTLAGVAPRLELIEVLGVVVLSILLVGALAVAGRDRPLPFGTATILFGGVVTMDAAITTLHHGAGAVAALLAGVATDLAGHRLRPCAERPAAMRLWAALAGASVAGAYFLTANAAGAHWPLELWLGTAVLTGLAGFMVAYAACPVPAALPVASVTMIRATARPDLDHVAV